MPNLLPAATGLAALLVLSTPGLDAGTDQFEVNTTTSGTQTSPRVASTPDGRIQVVWESDSSAGTAV